MLPIDFYCFDLLSRAKVELHIYTRGRVRTRSPIGLRISIGDVLHCMLRI